MNPILLEFPDNFDTERLTIRCPRPGDGAQVNAAILESQTELRPWFPWMKTLQTVEEHEVMMREAHGKWIQREKLWMLAFLKGTNELVASTGLHNCNWEVPSFEIGYWCRTKYAGQGYVTEATQAITQFAFEHLKARRVQLLCDDRNARSAATAERSGFQLEGILRNDSLDVDGNLRSTRIYSRIQ